MAQPGDVAVGMKRPAHLLPRPARSKQRKSAKPPASSKSWDEIGRQAIEDVFCSTTCGPSIPARDVSRDDLVSRLSGRNSAAGADRAAAEQNPGAVCPNGTVNDQPTREARNGDSDVPSSEHAAQRSSQADDGGFRGFGRIGLVRVASHEIREDEQSQAAGQQEQPVTAQNRQNESQTEPATQDASPSSPEPQPPETRHPSNISGVSDQPSGGKSLAGTAEGAESAGDGPPSRVVPATTPSARVLNNSAASTDDVHFGAQSQRTGEVGLPVAPQQEQLQLGASAPAASHLESVAPARAVGESVALPTANTQARPQTHDLIARVKSDPEPQEAPAPSGPYNATLREHVAVELRPDGVRECAEMTIAGELVCMRLSPCEVHMVASIRALPSLTNILHEYDLWEIYKELKAEEEKSVTKAMREGQASLTEKMQKLYQILPLAGNLTVALQTEAIKLLPTPSYAAMRMAMSTTMRSFLDGASTLKVRVAKGFSSKESVTNALKLAEKAITGTEQFTGVVKELQAGLAEYNAALKQSLSRAVIVTATRRICEKVNIPRPAREAVSARDKFFFNQNMTNLEQKITRQIFEIETARERIRAAQGRCRGGGHLQLPQEVNNALGEIERLIQNDLDALEQGEDHLWKVWGLVNKILKIYNSSGTSHQETNELAEHMIGLRQLINQSQLETLQAAASASQNARQQMPPPQPRAPASAAYPAGMATTAPPSVLSTAPVSQPQTAAAPPTHRQPQVTQQSAAAVAAARAASAPQPPQAQHPAASAPAQQKSRPQALPPLVDLTEGTSSIPSVDRPTAAGASNVPVPGGPPALARSSDEQQQKPYDTSQSYPAGQDRPASCDTSTPAGVACSIEGGAATVRHVGMDNTDNQAAVQSGPAAVVGGAISSEEENWRVARKDKREAKQRATDAVEGMGWLSRKLDGLLEEVYRADKMKIFREPVKTAIAPDYYNVIKQPICLKEIQKKMKSKAYTAKGSIRAAVDALKADLELMVNNCLTYNPPTNAYHRFGKELGQVVRQQFAKLERKIAKKQLP